uniref:CLOCK-interacting pacemaker-like n=1 Tax=Scophthalmus maximus TaxID=52904 RepID=A0A8D3EEW5_SCOMX
MPGDHFSSTRTVMMSPPLCPASPPLCCPDTDTGHVPSCFPQRTRAAAERPRPRPAPPRPPHMLARTSTVSCHMSRGNTAARRESEERPARGPWTRSGSVVVGLEDRSPSVENARGRRWRRSPRGGLDAASPECQKDKGIVGSAPARSTSKNAKDRSNSATLRASKSGNPVERPGMGDMRNRMLRCDSEKDSGYSETGSDSVHTDVDDQRSSVSEPHRQNSKSSNNSVNAAGGNMPPYKELTPIYVIKNLVVKPSRPDQLLHGPLTWEGGWHSLTGTKAPNQFVLIQEPAIPDSSTATPTPSSCQVAPQAQVKTGRSQSHLNHGSKNSYLPILNSYPRIAPHPRKESHEDKGTTWAEGVKEGGAEGHSQSKRVCTEVEKWEAESTTHSYSQYKARGHNSYPILSHCPLPSHTSSTTHHRSHGCQQSSGSESVSSPSVSITQTPSPPSSSDSPSSSSPPSSSPSSSTAHSPHRLPPDGSSTRQRRFLNTAEILNQSGLLAITLRTKELLKQNVATEREIAQLRQHTHLLCQVAQLGQSGCRDGLDSLEILLQDMTKSASYPNLDLNPFKALSSSHQWSKARTEEAQENDYNIRTTKTHSNQLQVCPCTGTQTNGLGQELP